MKSILSVSVSLQDLRRKIWTLSDSLEKAESSSLSSAAAERDIEDKLCTINDLKDRNSKLLSQNNVRIISVVASYISLPCYVL